MTNDDIIDASAKPEDVDSEPLRPFGRTQVCQNISRAN